MSVKKSKWSASQMSKKTAVPVFMHTEKVAVGTHNARSRAFGIFFRTSGPPGESFSAFKTTLASVVGRAGLTAATRRASAFGLYDFLDSISFRRNSFGIRSPLRVGGARTRKRPED